MAGNNPLHQFEIHPLAKLNIAGMDVSFTNSSLFMVLAILSVTFFLTLGMRKREMVPGRWQAMSELSYQFVANIIKENIGQEGRKFFPFIFSLFMFILFCNLLGMLPLGHAVFTPTSHIAVTFALAMVVFLMVIIVGVAKHGFHFLHLFIPSGLPKWLVPIIIPIEMLSFLARPISLSVRLAAAMTAGHILLKVIAGFVVMLGIAGGWLPLGLMVALVGLEIFIAFLQAYIFSLLTSMYLNDAIHLH
jgi:F-type H+-transporting ATPase subunit a